MNLDFLNQGNLDIGALASQFGISQEQASGAIGGLLPTLLNGGDIGSVIGQVAAQTGLDPAMLQNMLPSLAQMGGAAGGEGGLGGMLGGLVSGLDRDGDGNPLNDILGGFGSR